MQEMFFDAMEQLLGDCCTPAHIRRIEKGGAASAERAALWSALIESGFADALVAEDKGGAGLSLSDAYPVAFVAGRHALPLPFAQTMAVRGVLAAAGNAAPDGAITIASSAARQADGSVVCSHVPFGLIADWVVAEFDDSTYMLSVADAEATPAGGNGTLDASLRWAALPATATRLAGGFWRAFGASVSAALLAGAMERMFEITVGYANDRVQFGKPIAKLQVIQQQISVMAEQVFAARMAAQIGFSASGTVPDTLSAAVAKQRTGEAVAAVSAIAHAVHGAMGFTEEYDLQLFTRRIHEWRLAYGTEAYWSAVLGRDVIAADDVRALDFVRTRIAA